MNDEPRVLFLDLEISPLLAWSFGPMYEARLLDLKSGWHILCFSYRWLHEDKIHTVALPDFKTYKRDKEDDSKLCKELWKLFDQASVVVAHNVAFDAKRSFARFVKHNLPPPSPCEYFCTLREARKTFAFTSNKLSDLARYLLGDRKLPVSWDNWRHVLAGSKKHWSILKTYNRHDVDLLYRLYEKFKGWSKSHPRLTIPHQETFCPTCTSERTIKRGVKHYRKRSVQQRKCLDCEAWFLAEPIK